MGKRGPPPKPTRLRVIQGNPGRRPLPKKEAQPELGIPERPSHLDAIASAEWERVADELHQVGLLAKIDSSMLAAYCQAYARWRTAEESIARMARNDPHTQGLIIKTGNGNAVQNPLVGVANRALQIMMRAAGEFGMTPSARARIAAAKSEIKDDDPAEAFFKSG